MSDLAVKPFNVMSLGKASLELFNPKEMGYHDSLNIIKDESVKVQNSFVKIGWYLKHIQDDELYREDGYANVYECAADQLGYSQSTVSRFINICEKFSKDHNSPVLDEKYAGFDKSQMIEMLPMNQEQLEEVTPEMTVRQIRDIKKCYQKKLDVDVKEQADSIIPGQTSIEEDFPEFLPENSQEEEYAASHKEMQGNEKYDEVVDSKETDICPDQPELPVLKNTDQRKEWLCNYKAWGLWYRDENIDVNYYKFDFPDGSRLVVAEYPQRYCYWDGKKEDEFYYHLLEKDKQGYGKKTYDEAYRNRTDSETYLVEFLKTVEKRKRG